MKAATILSYATEFVHDLYPMSVFSLFSLLSSCSSALQTAAPPPVTKLVPVVCQNINIFLPAFL